VSGAAVSLADALSTGLLGSGANGAETRSLGHLVASATAGGVFLVILGLVVALLAVVLLCTYVARVAILVVLVVAAPLALVCHALPQTESVAQLWWRGLAACLGIQGRAGARPRRRARRPDGTELGRRARARASGLVDLVVMICLLVVLVRIPSWAMRAALAAAGARACAC